MTANTDVRDAVCQQIVTSNLVPTTTLSASAAIGATTVTVTDPTIYRANGIFDWNDGTKEFPTKITSIAVSVLTLSFQGRSITGLQYAHASGAQVVSNLLRSPANPADATVTGIMTNNGRPVWRVYALDAITNPDNSLNMQPTHFVEIVHQLPAESGASPLETDLFVQLSQERAQTDIELLAAAIRRNYTLTLNGVATATIVQRYMSSSRQVMYGPTTGQQTALFEHYLAVQVLGLQVQLGP